MTQRTKTFTIECTMNERWIPYLISALKKMEYDGHVGKKEIIGMMARGDLDFTPRFSTDVKYYEVNPSKPEDVPLVVYDAKP